MHKTHGMSNTKPYHIWRAMKNRCKNASSNRYHVYGGRGIKVCDEWAKSFEAFWRDMGSTYKEGLTLDRIDGNENYCKSNCRWVDQKTQQRNRRNNAVVSTPFGRITIAELSEITGINYQTLESRHWRGCPDEELLGGLI